MTSNDFLDQQTPGSGSGWQRQVPNSTPVLILGILSIAMCWCYGFLSVILAVIALVLSRQAERDYRLNPGAYTQSSYKNLRAGKTCAIIGLCLSGLAIVIAIIYLILFGTLALSLVNMGFEQ